MLSARGPSPNGRGLALGSHPRRRPTRSSPLLGLAERARRLMTAPVLGLIVSGAGGADDVRKRLVLPLLDESWTVAVT